MVFITLAKHGDQLAHLPIIHHWFKQNKRKPTMMVSRQYSSILRRVPYVEPMIYEGDWSDLSGALKLAKQKFNDVTVLSTFGNGFPIQHRTSSFVLDAYDRAGCLHLWDTLKLELERRTQPEILKQYPRIPTILLADHSQSSPFLQKHQLYDLLVNEFPNHVIVRLQEYKFPHIVDCLSWYDKAAAVVCVESAHLHLTAATKTPVVALATDKPTRWNGSAWSKRFAFYCRYSEFDERKEEMIEAMKDAMNGVKKKEAVILN